MLDFFSLLEKVLMPAGRSQLDYLLPFKDV